MGEDILYIDGKPVAGDVSASQVINDGPAIGDDVAAALTNLDGRVTPNTAQLGATMENTSGGNLSLGAVVKLGATAQSFTTTATAGDPDARYVLLEDIDAAATGRVASSGYATVLTTGVVAVGDTLGASTTAGYAAAGETGVGVALTASGGGLASVLAVISGGSATATTPPRALVWHSVNQSIPTSAATFLTFNTERYDTDAIHSGGNPTRLTAPVDGKYLIVGGAAFDAGIGFVQLTVVLNGLTDIARNRQAQVGSGLTSHLIISVPYELSAGDYVELEAVQTTGAAANVISIANDSPFFAMH